MVKWLHVIASGTSILRNFELKRSEDAGRLGITGWFRLPPNHPAQEEAVRAARSGSKHEVFSVLSEFLRQSPETVSAELNAFLKYVSLANHAPPHEVGVLIFSTDTGTGYLCAALIHEYLRREGYAVVTNEPVRVEGLGTSEESFDDGLANLLDKVVNVIREKTAEGIKVYVNATAGFKAETSFLTMAAALAGATAAYYIHEAFREVIELPLPPLTINPKVRKLITLTGREGLSIGEFEETARSQGLNPNDLLERKLFILKGKVYPRKWLTLIAEV